MLSKQKTYKLPDNVSLKINEMKSFWSNVWKGLTHIDCFDGNVNITEQDASSFVFKVTKNAIFFLSDYLYDLKQNIHKSNYIRRKICFFLFGEVSL